MCTTPAGYGYVSARLSETVGSSSRWWPDIGRQSDPPHPHIEASAPALYKQDMQWSGVIPAITTPFNEDLTVDHAFLAKHCRWLVDNGCAGVVALGSLGEGATLTMPEKQEVLETCMKAIGDRAVVVAGVSALGTAEAVAIAKMAEQAGCNGVM